MNKFYSMLGIAKKAGFIVSGETGCVQIVKKSKCKLMILASDASDNTKNKFMSLCNKNKIELITIGSKAELGSAIGKSLTSTIAVLDDKFTSTLLDVIGKGITCK